MGIKFEGLKIGANCFNCGFKARYDELDGIVSKNFRKLLLAFGIANEEIDRAASEHFFKPKNEDAPITLASLTEVNLFTPEIKLPPLSFRIRSDNCPEENAYLASRKISCDDYPFYASVGKKHKNRIIIPFYKYGKLIYWQARTIVEDKPRYKNCEVSKEAVMFNIDRLWFNSLNPVFITEGVFCALMTGGIAIMGSSLTEAKIQLFKQSKRNLYFVIDEDKNGVKLAEQVMYHKLGKITTVGNGLDINASCIQYGKLWTFYQLIKNELKTETDQKLFLRRIKAKV
jgi:hypothetical protein